MGGGRASVVSEASVFEEALALRFRVFCDEQGVPRELERDDGDAIALHALVRSEAGEVVATGRVVRARVDGSFAALDDEARAGDLARVGRMAVAREARGQGLGSEVIGLLERAARAAGLERALLHAQLQAERFYAARGYVRGGPEFEEAGIAHVAMVKEL